MSDVGHALAREAEAARTLLLNIADVVADDEDAKQDAIEGETNFKEAATHAVARLAEIEALSDAIKAQRANLSDRLSRLEQQSENIRAAIQAAMATAELAKLELAQATITLKAVPPKAVVVSEADVPSEFWKRADPKLDLKALLAALKDKRVVPGAELSNGGQTVQFRWR